MRTCSIVAVVLLLAGCAAAERPAEKRPVVDGAEVASTPPQPGGRAPASGAPAATCPAGDPAATPASPPATPPPARAEAPVKGTGQVFFRGAFSRLTTGDRGNEIFTDTASAGRANNGQGGWSAACGLDVPLIHELLPQVDALGEIFVEYSEFSRERVVLAPTALVGKPDTAPLTVSELTVAVAPKVRIDIADGLIRPWVIPIGMAFLVNAPPSNSTGYLDLGMHFGLGADVRVAGPVRLGVDFRYTLGLDRANAHNDYFSSGGYLGIDF